MKVQIQIRGRKYTVRSDEDGEDLVAIARYVDSKMSEIAGRGSSADEYTVAMLAALNIASEFDRFRRQVDRDLASVDRELASTAMVLDAALGSDA
ncbi:MAG: cell division protein ZapA [Myxococcota bacterium]